MICLAMRKGASECGNLRVKQGKYEWSMRIKMIMWDVEDSGGSACYAMGRKAIIVNDMAGYGFNREPE